MSIKNIYLMIIIVLTIGIIEGAIMYYYYQDMPNGNPEYINKI